MHEHTDVELLVLYNMNYLVLDILTAVEQQHLFDDNGFDPDGPSWYIPSDEVDTGALLELLNRNLGYLASGVAVREFVDDYDMRQYMRGLNPFKWCGYGIRDTAYYIPKGAQDAR